MTNADQRTALPAADNDGDARSRRVKSRMPDGNLIGAAYRTALQREERLHAALGIPWQVSDGARSFLVLLPGLPRMDAGPVVPWVPPLAVTYDHEPWMIPMMMGWARETLGFTVADVASALGTTARTLERWSRGASVPRGRHRAQLDALQALRALLASAFITPAHALIWLRTPPGLAYETSPRMMVEMGAIRPLVAILASLESGAFR